MQEYIFTSYDKRFPQMFIREKVTLKEILPFATEIEHFGSTAVPGLKGKGVLDVYILVPKNKLQSANNILGKHGYSFYNTKQMSKGTKMIFRKEYRYAGKTRKVNIHLGTIGIEDFNQVLLFRDALRNNPVLCREYEKVKKAAVAKTTKSGEDSKENSRIYVEAKDTFIKNYTKKKY